MVGYDHDSVDTWDTLGFADHHREVPAMLRLRVVLLGLMLSSMLVGCQWGKSSTWSAPAHRSDDPLLCTDAERKRPRDLYATTSDSHYTSPAPIGGR